MRHVVQEGSPRPSERGCRRWEGKPTVHVYWIESEKVKFACEIVLRASEYESYEVGRILASDAITCNFKSMDPGRRSFSGVPWMKGIATGRFREIHHGPTPIEGKNHSQDGASHKEIVVIGGYSLRLYTNHEVRKFHNQWTKHRILHSKRRTGMKSPCTARMRGRDTPQT